MNKKKTKKELKDIIKDADYKMLPVKKLKPAKYNPRIITEAQLDHLEASMKKGGNLQPIVVNKDMTIIGGHQRHKVLMRNKIKKTICAIVNLSKATEMEMNLAMNQISGFWDEDMRNEIIYKLKDSDIIGFEDEEKEQMLLQREMTLETEGRYDPDDEDDVKKIFERNEKIPIGVEEPGTSKRKDRLSFYTENWKQYDSIRKFFETKASGELDIEKLTKLIKK